MLSQTFQEQLKNQLKGELLFQEPMARYTTIKVGGPADALFYPKDLDDLQKAIQFCYEKDIPYFIFGNGSNLIIRDGGIRGLVIRLNRCLNQFGIVDEKNPPSPPLKKGGEGGFQDEVILYAQSGVMLPKVVEFCKQNGLSGLESLYGVPGTVGGAVIMNAGTREGEIGESILELKVMDAKGEIKTYPQKRLHFEYRDLKIPRTEIAIEARFKLKKSDVQKVAEKIEFFQKRRLQTQPLDQPNCGSVFKNPPKKFAAELIEELGLKGVRVGGARVSEKHSNWIVNEGGATANDVLVLIGLVRDKVKEATQIRLEAEVKVVGEE